MRATAFRLGKSERGVETHKERGEKWRWRRTVRWNEGGKVKKKKHEAKG